MVGTLHIIYTTGEHHAMHFNDIAEAYHELKRYKKFKIMSKFIRLMYVEEGQ